MSAASYMGQPYSSIQHSLAVSGKELVTFTRQDFINYDSMYGDRLYDLLHSQRVSNLRTYVNFNMFMNFNMRSPTQRTPSLIKR